MRVVTTVHKAGFEQYGDRFIEGMKNWPEPHFLMYAEGFIPVAKGVDILTVRRIEDLERLEVFKKQYSHYKPISWQWDVVRFANKVFAAYDAFYDYDGLCVWLDCDAVTYRKIPEGYIESLLPDGALMALFKRIGYHTETGFWLMDGKHPEKKAFLDSWVSLYEGGGFQGLAQWHDCETLDTVVRKFEKEGRAQTVSLSQGFEREMHPMALADIGKYIDHTKGNRKAAGFSPENIHREAA